MTPDERMRRASERLIVAEANLIVTVERLRVEQEAALKRYLFLAGWEWRP